MKGFLQGLEHPRQVSKIQIPGEPHLERKAAFMERPIQRSKQLGN